MSMESEEERLQWMLLHPRLRAPAGAGGPGGGRGDDPELDQQDEDQDGGASTQVRAVVHA